MAPLLKSLLPALFFLALTVHTRDSAAQSASTTPQTALWTEHRWSLEGQYAPLLNSPLGMAGINVDYVLDPSVSLTAGVGFSLTSRAPQFSLMGRPRIFVDGLPFFGGLGLSAGNYTPALEGLFQEGYYTAHRLNPALWLNAEVGIENRGKGGISYRFSIGVSQLLNTGSWECQSIEKGKPASQWESCPSFHAERFPITIMPYISVVVGVFR